MPLPSSGPITLQQIQSEYSVSGLQAASTAAGLNPLPTAMRDFMGLSAASAYLDPGGYYFDSIYNDQDASIIQAFIAIEFLADGRLQITQGNNSVTATPYINGGQWLSTSPGTVSNSVAQGWDLELTKVSGPPDGVFTTNLVFGGYREITSTGTAFGARTQLGVSNEGRYLLVTIATSGNPYMWDETLIFTASIYLHGTNTLVASATFELYVQASSMAPI